MQITCIATRTGLLLLLCLVASAASEAGASDRGPKAFAAPVDLHRKSDASSSIVDGVHIEGTHQLLRSTANTRSSATLSRAASILTTGESAAVGKVLDPRAVMEMERSVTELLTNANGATPMQSSVQQIKNLVKNTMMPKVELAHRASQMELDRLLATFKGCRSVKHHGLTQAQKKKRIYEKSSPLHQACRQGEAALVTEAKSCTVSLKAAKQVRDLTCQRVKDMDAQWANEARNKEIVAKMNGESAKMYIKRMSATFCGDGDGKAGGSRLQRYTAAEEECSKADKKVDRLTGECKDKSSAHKLKVKECENLQLQMDQAACARTIMIKDSCESYAQCYMSERTAYNTTAESVKKAEKDRKSEWRALARMTCLIDAFQDGKVTEGEVSACKEASHDTQRLDIEYAEAPEMLDCIVPNLYPATAAYKKKEFAPLPVLAKGNPEANECYGVLEISTQPKAGSPLNCKCERVTLNGPYRAGPMVRCTRCLDVFRSVDKDSCPDGTKIFSPRTRSDWKTVFNSLQPLRAPNWIIDITRPQNGCGGCSKSAMNSDVATQKSWVTSDGSPWWLRSSLYSEPNGDYMANCYMDLWRSPSNEDAVTFNDKSCSYHSSSYYCQAKQLSTKPKYGSPQGCACTTVALTGRYSPGALLKCVGCIDVRRSNDKNSCPIGTKLFSPRSREDWKTFIDSAVPLRSPNWIIDITRPQNGCGGCNREPMNFESPGQVSWVTEDRSPWWLRSTTYNEPNGDYKASCYMDLWHNPANADSVTFNDGNCNYHSNSYYCQSTLTKTFR